MRLLGARPLERPPRCVEPQRTPRHRPHPQCEPPADAVLVERHLRRGRGQCEIAAPCTDLVKTNADTRIAQTGKRTAVRQAVAGNAVVIGPTKKSEAAISAL